MLIVNILKVLQVYNDWQVITWQDWYQLSRQIWNISLYLVSHPLCCFSTELHNTNITTHPCPSSSSKGVGACSPICWSVECFQENTRKLTYDITSHDTWHYWMIFTTNTIFDQHKYSPCFLLYSLVSGVSKKDKFQQ